MFKSKDEVRYIDVKSTEHIDGNELGQIHPLDGEAICVRLPYCKSEHWVPCYEQEYGQLIPCHFLYIEPPSEFTRLSEDPYAQPKERYPLYKPDFGFRKAMVLTLGGTWEAMSLLPHLIRLVNDSKTVGYRFAGSVFEGRGLERRKVDQATIIRNWEDVLFPYCLSYNCNSIRLRLSAVGWVGRFARSIIPEFRWQVTRLRRRIRTIRGPQEPLARRNRVMEPE